ncbi:ABC transporter permease [Secundilactobacillus paracollinoides]|uniref:ABC transporter permease n=1 Tax=Secundilactobacillus paracollinoides TaxID=240427 RepID=UPI0006EF7F89|nr:ABC transporter permease [Secundilactobacillus paracollinoides]KRL80979.1 multidrug ABC transporter permease [Secundilactobacillus paracollinoides DSM 15502 = JCM 11969]
MTAFIKRNLQLFFTNGSNLFFSLLGALISFVLYIVFLKQNMASALPFTGKSAVLDPWVIGGTLTVTAVTTTLSALSQMIQDRERGTLADFLMTKLAYWQLQTAYLVSAFIVGWIMQIIMAGVMYAYFAAVDGITIPWKLTPQLIGIAGFSSLIWTAFSLLCLSFVKKVDTLGKLGTIIGTASGFFAGVYIPIESVPKAAQTLMKITPAPYNAALYRQLLMKTALNDKFSGARAGQKAAFETAFGVRLKLGSVLSLTSVYGVMLAFLVGFVIVALLLMRRSRKQVMVRI